MEVSFDIFQLFKTYDFRIFHLSCTFVEENRYTNVVLNRNSSVSNNFRQSSTVPWHIMYMYKTVTFTFVLISSLATGELIYCQR